MSSLSDAYDRGGRRRSVARAVCLLVGSLVAAVGFVATAASLIVGLGVPKAAALKVAVLLGGTLPLAAFLVPRVTFLVPRAATSGGSRSLSDGSRSFALALAGVAVLAGVAGLGLFWATLPTGWTGNLARLPPVALGTYAVGLVAAFGAWLVADADDAEDRRGDSAAPNSSESASRDADSLGGVTAATRVDDEGSGRPVNAQVDAPDSPGVGDGPSVRAVGDGGEDGDDVEFFDDETP